MLQILSQLPTWQIAILTIIFLIFVELARSIITSVYNIFFHPLRSFSSSFWDIAAPFNRCYHTYKGSVPQSILTRHKQLGEVVRTAPNILSFTSPEAWKDIYGHGNDMPKTFANIGFSDDSLFAAGKEDHKRLRKLISPAFTDKSLSQQEPLITVHVNKLIDKLRNKKCDMIHWFTAVTFDIMGDLAFGHQLQGLDNKTNTWVETLSRAIYLIPFLDLVQSTRVGTILNFLLRPKMKQFKQEREVYIGELLNARLGKENRGDLIDHLAEKLSQKELAANSDLFMTAATHTTTIVLSSTLYFLLTNPESLEKAKEEIHTSFASDNEISFKSCTELRYLQAVINEAMRIFPPVPIAMERKTIAPTMIAGKLIPSGTVVGVPSLATYHSERYFHKALEFHPERWLGVEPFQNDRRQVFHPFSVGPRDCIGQTLAGHEIRLILSKILWHFDLNLDEKCRDWQNQRVYALWELPPLHIGFTDRKF